MSGIVVSLFEIFTECNEWNGERMNEWMNKNRWINLSDGNFHSICWTQNFIVVVIKNEIEVLCCHCYCGARNNQLRIIHTARERRHFHFTYDFKVSATHAFHFTCRKMIARSFIFQIKTRFHSIRKHTHTHTQSVWCTKCTHRHTQRRSYMHICINNTHKYPHICINKHRWNAPNSIEEKREKRNTFLSLLWLLSCALYTLWVKRVFCSSFEIFVLPFIMIQMQWNLYDHE